MSTIPPINYLSGLNFFYTSGQENTVPLCEGILTEIDILELENLSKEKNVKFSD